MLTATQPFPRSHGRKVTQGNPWEAGAISSVCPNYWVLYFTADLWLDGPLPSAPCPEGRGQKLHPKQRSLSWSVAAAVVTVAIALVSPAASAAQESILYKFTGGYDGGIPYSGLVFDTAGNLYGTTTYGGINVFYGAVFELTRVNGKWKEHVLYSFKGGKDGSYPQAGVVFDSAGNLYGATSYQGTYGYGTVFKLTPTNGRWKESVLYAFKGSSKDDGEYPWGGVILDKAGNLYGTTQLGGPASQTCPNGCGTVYKLTHSKQGWKETRLYSFTGQNGDGAGASSGLTLDRAGRLFGTTQQGGSTGYGTVYQLAYSKSGWKESVLYQFSGTTDGANPNSGLIMDKAANLYGTTNYGGAIGGGTVFELKHSQTGWDENVLYSSNGFPGGNLVFDHSGNLYGSETAVGCCGAVFELTPNQGQWEQTVLYTFTGSSNKDGSAPNGSLIFDGAGNLYGTTSQGGYGPCWGGLGCGVIFHLSP
jgi:uncharacterized repeat protein (TIGR03803 family)